MGPAMSRNFSCTEFYRFFTKIQIKSSLLGKPGVFIYQNATVDILVDNFDCHMNKMTKTMKKTLKEDQYPKVIIDIKKIKLPDQRLTRLQNGDDILATADVTIAGATKEYQIAFNDIIIKNNQVTFDGKLDLDMTAHDIEPPTVMGFIKVSQLINIEFKLDFQVW